MTDTATRSQDVLSEPPPGYEVARWVVFTGIATLLVYAVRSANALWFERSESLFAVFGDGSLVLVASVFSSGALGSLLDGPRTWPRMALLMVCMVLMLGGVFMYPVLLNHLRAGPALADTEYAVSMDVLTDEDVGGDPLSNAVVLRDATPAELARGRQFTELARVVLAQEYLNEQWASERHSLQVRITVFSLVLVLSSVSCAVGAVAWEQRNRQRAPA